jgi:hypothetical protein
MDSQLPVGRVGKEETYYSSSDFLSGGVFPAIITSLERIRNVFWYDLDIEIRVSSPWPCRIGGS